MIDAALVYFACGMVLSILLIIADLCGDGQIIVEIRKQGFLIGPHAFLIAMFIVLVFAWPFWAGLLLWTAFRRWTRR